MDRKDLEVLKWGVEATKDVAKVVYTAFVESNHDLSHLADLGYRKMVLLVTGDLDHEFQTTEGSNRLILFIHGYLGDKKNFVDLANDLKEYGNQLFVNYNTFQDIAISAEAIKQVLDEYLLDHPHITEVGIVAHSMGGLVATELICHHDQNREYAFCITLGTPFRGTELAKMGLGTSAKQMKPGSPFIKKLWDSIHQEERTHFFTLSAEQDYVVRTSTEPTAVLELGKKQSVDTTHLGLLRDKNARDEVKKWLENFLVSSYSH